MKGQIEILNGQIDKYQRLYNYATNRNKRLEAEIIDLNEYPEKSNKNNEELEAKIISVKEELYKENEELLQAFEEQENGLKEEILKLNDQVQEGRRIEEIMKK